MGGTKARLSPGVYYASRGRTGDVPAFVRRQPGVRPVVGLLESWFLQRRSPSSTVLRVGKHAGEDPRVRSNETLGYVVLEAGTGSIGAINYVAGVGPDSIKGVGNKPPYRYAISGLSSAATAIVSQAAMDNANGGWAILYGDNPILASGLNIAIDEDGAWDTERSHSTEQVMYIVFE